jgi:hypothetical protein
MFPATIPSNKTLKHNGKIDAPLQKKQPFEKRMCSAVLQLFAKNYSIAVACGV